MRLKEIVLAVSLASCAGAPKITRTPGADGIIGNLPGTVCPENYTQHVEEVGLGERIAIRACLKNDVPDIRNHCEKVYSGNNGPWHLYGGQPYATEKDGVLMWDCEGMAVQSLGTGIHSATVGSGIYSATVPTETKVEEVKQVPDSPRP